MRGRAGDICRAAFVVSLNAFNCEPCYYLSVVLIVSWAGFVATLPVLSTASVFNDHHLKLATIESHTQSNPTRDSLPLSDVSALEPVPIVAGTSQLSYPSFPAPDSSQSLVPTTRSRSDLEEVSSTDILSPHHTDAEHTRAYKRQRVESSRSTPSIHSSIDQTTHTFTCESRNTMRVPESDRKSSLSVSPDLGVCSGPLGGAMGGGPGPSNGHTNGNSLITHMMKAASAATNGVHRHGKSVARVNLPGTTLYEDSFVDREEFIRLVIQSLRDVGYKESAATLEAESGYPLEAPEVSEFRRYVQDGLWVKAENSLMRLGIRDDEGLWDARFLISQQKYLELLEAGKTTAALHVLRNELAPLDVDPDHLHTLSSFIMCSEPDDLRRRAGWDGASGNSRQRLLTNLHRFIPSTIMIPQRRFSTLLHQARSYQRQRCVYHNSPSNSSAFSLYTDHQCNKSAFPRTTTTILTGHTDEVWNMEWSHDGTYLASASKDKTVIIWRIESRPESSDSSIHDWGQYVILRNHPYPVGCLAWSLDDSVLLTSAEHHIKMWNAKTGVCMRDLEDHSEPVTALAWLPDGSGFISGGLDRRIILWDADGSLRDSWGATAIRVTDLAITPDFTRLVTVGIPAAPSGNDTSPSRPPQVGDSTSVAAGGNPVPNGSRTTDNQMIVYDLNTKQVESSTRLDGELTSVKLSQNSQYALINHAPNEIHLWDLSVGQLARKFTGLQQGKHVIRSCFGGVDGNFVVSGSEDANVYVWHRDTGTLLEVLSGHGEGSVNSVAWNPRNERMFASCSDDQTVRIWEALPPEMMEDSSSVSQPDLAFMNGKGKGKTRQHWDGDDVDVDSDFTSSR